MSREFNELPEGEQMDVEQDYFDSKNEQIKDPEPRPYIGEDVSVTFRGKIVAIEQDVWNKERVLIKICNEDGDTITVHDALITR